MQIFETKPQRFRERSALQAQQHKPQSHGNINSKWTRAPAVQHLLFVILQYFFLLFMCLVCTTLPVCLNGCWQFLWFCFIIM